MGYRIQDKGKTMEVVLIVRKKFGMSPKGKENQSRNSGKLSWLVGKITMQRHTQGIITSKRD